MSLDHYGQGTLQHQLPRFLIQLPHQQPIFGDGFLTKGYKRVHFPVCFLDSNLTERAAIASPLRIQSQSSVELHNQHPSLGLQRTYLHIFTSLHLKLYIQHLQEDANQSRTWFIGSW